MLLCCFFCASRNLNAQCALAFKARGLTNTRLQRVLQSIVGNVCAGGEVIPRHGALNQSENILDLTLINN